jgi:hypothetical protein
VDELWAITSYFNPAKYTRRKSNYRAFRQQLNVPLATVELSLDGAFEIGPDEADVLVQVRSRDVMWQKERLLNLALDALPASCTKVTWLDCDIVFDRADWARRTRERLDRFPLVQPFSAACRAMPREWQPGQEVPAGLREWRSVPSLIDSGLTVVEAVDARATDSGASLGLAWAARREIFEASGFYDANIVGGGDSLMMRAAYGRFDAAMDIQMMNEWQRRHFMDWATGFHGAIAGNVGFVEGMLFHLWHGDPVNRGYEERFTGLRQFGFDPFADIALNEHGAWQWNSDKPALHEYVRDYFRSRKEDG